MRRRWMLTGVWVLSTLAATLVAWGAVRQVADQVSPAAGAAPPTGIALSDVEVADVAAETTAPVTPRARQSSRPRPAARATDTAAPTQTAGADSEPNAPDDQPAGQPAQEPDRQPEAPQDDEAEPEPEPVATTQAYDLVGGVVTVRYQGTSTRLVEASPNSGFVVEVHDGGPGKVDVRFRSDEHESRFVTRIRNGEPDPQRDERPR